MYSFTRQIVITFLLVSGLLFNSLTLTAGTALRWCSSQHKICSGSYSSPISCVSDTQKSPTSKCCQSQAEKASCCSRNEVPTDQKHFSNLTNCQCCINLSEPPVTPTSRPVELVSSLLLQPNRTISLPAFESDFHLVAQPGLPPTPAQPDLCVWLN